MHAFDRQTDRQTNGRIDRILIARPRLNSMQRGKNYGTVGEIAESRFQGQPRTHTTPCDIGVLLVRDRFADWEIMTHFQIPCQFFWEQCCIPPNSQSWGQST